MSAKTFNQIIWQFYQTNKRDFPWRRTTDPYRILVSEVMLQQTQTARVVPYFETFFQVFPTMQSLAAADTKTVLATWQGLGYNRRALFLQRAAQKIVRDFNGQVPTSLEELTTLPGVGAHTAGAVLAYAFNQPAIFVETNIRKAIIHSFFASQAKVSDREIIAQIEQTLDRQKPRDWYWAVVDYGHWLAQTKTIRNERSAHYYKQSQFVGSKRFTRSQILKLLLDRPRPKAEITKQLDDLPHVSAALAELVREGFCQQRGQIIEICR